MACNKKYNGWTNYATWNVALWIDNEEGTHKYWREVARLMLRQNRKKSDAIWALAKNMEEQIRYDGNPLADQASVYSDLLGSALSEVNWYEVAKSRFDE
jgi:hypothetical protein